MKDESLNSLGKRVSDLKNYASSLVSFDKELDGQLKALIGLTDDEFHYIQSKVKK